MRSRGWLLATGVALMMLAFAIPIALLVTRGAGAAHGDIDVSCRGPGPL